MINWNESEILVDRKSKFQGRCCSISNELEIPNLLVKLIQENKNINKASHMHIYAWRTADIDKSNNENIKFRKSNKNQKQKEGKKSNNHLNINLKNIQQGYSDCGESGAGQKLLTLLERANIYQAVL